MMVLLKIATQTCLLAMTYKKLYNCRTRPGGEMVDTLALGASVARHGGSSPLPGTEGDTLCLKHTNRLINRANLETSNHL